ncbi:hypothetical protein ACEPAG_4287 [Sanghuangporus baumii]
MSLDTMSLDTASADTASDVTSILPDAKHIKIGNLAYINCLAALYHQTWKDQNPDRVYVTHKVVRDRPDDQANVPVPEYITALEWTVYDQVPLILWNQYKSRGILLRDEYRFILARIWEFFGREGGIESGYVPKPEIELSDAIGPPYNPFKGLHIEHSGEDEVPGVVVTGTPGIGKSLFLLVLLAQRLLAQQTTIYQFKSGEFVLFHATGVYHSELVKKEFVFLPQHTWFLVDSNDQNYIPPPSFLEACNSSSRKIVMAASPRETHFTFYSKHRTFVTLWMEPFSEAEIIAARNLQGRRTPIAERALEKFFRLYGPSARVAFEKAKTPDDHEADIVRNIGGVDWDGIVKIIRDIGRGFFETKFSDLVLIARRQGKNPREWYVEFASKHIANLVYTAFNVREAEKGNDLYRQFLKTPKARASAGGLLEASVLNIFPLGGQWQMRKMTRNPKRPINQKNQHWSFDDESRDVYTLLIGHQGHAVKIEDGQQNKPSLEFASVKRIIYHGDPPKNKERAFYIPAADNQLSFDGWLYEPATDHTVILQVTVRFASHDIKPEGLGSLGSNRVDLVVVSDDKGGKDVNTPLHIADLIDNVYRLEY